MAGLAEPIREIKDWSDVVELHAISALTGIKSCAAKDTHR